MRMKKRILSQGEAKTDEKRILCKFTFSPVPSLSLIVQFYFNEPGFTLFLLLRSNHLKLTGTDSPSGPVFVFLAILDGRRL